MSAGPSFTYQDETRSLDKQQTFPQELRLSMRPEHVAVRLLQQGRVSAETALVRQV